MQPFRLPQRVRFAPVASTHRVDPDAATETHKRSNIADILARFGDPAEAKRARTDQSFLVPFAELKANAWTLSINRYRQVVYAQVKYATPAELINGTKQEPGLRPTGRRAREVVG